MLTRMLTEAHCALPFITISVKSLSVEQLLSGANYFSFGAARCHAVG